MVAVLERPHKSLSQGLAALAARLKTSDDDRESWAPAVLGATRELEQEIAAGEALRLVAASVLNVAEDGGYEQVTGASRMGDQVAGAAVALSSKALRLWLGGPMNGPVLIVDGVLATGTQMAAMAQEARLAGASRVGGVAVVATRNGLRFARDEVGDVTVLESN